MKRKILLLACLISVTIIPACSTMTTIVHEVEREAQAQIAVDDRFPETGGLISDSVSGLQWQVGPDSSTDWMTANLWVENLDGNGWEMPSKEDLLGLHNAGVNWNNYGPFYIEGTAVWSDSTSPHGANAWIFDFMVGTGSMANTSESRGNRAFAVRKETGTR